MSISTGYIRDKTAIELQLVSGVVNKIHCDYFQISETSEFTSWEDLTSIGNAYDCVNCEQAGKTSNTLKMMVYNDVSSFSFKMDNDLSNTQFIFACEPAISLPLISISELKTKLNVNDNNVINLCSSPNISDKSPRRIAADIYNPNNVGLPSIAGRPLGSSPYSLGQFAGYLHTAKDGFNILNFNNVVVEYKQTLSLYDNPIVIKNHIPIAGDTDTADNFTKWNVKINNDAVNFNNKSHYQLPDANITSINIKYFNGSTYVDLVTYSRTITYLGNPYIRTLSITSINPNLRRIYYTLVIQKIRDTIRNYSNVNISVVNGSGSPVYPTGSGSLGNGGTWTTSGYLIYRTEEFWEGMVISIVVKGSYGGATEENIVFADETIPEE